MSDEKPTEAPTEDDPIVVGDGIQGRWLDDEQHARDDDQPDRGQGEDD